MVTMSQKSSLPQAAKSVSLALTPDIAAMAPENVFHPVHVAILLRREDQTLQNFLNIWIAHVEMDGTLAAIRKKWLG